MRPTTPVVGQRFRYASLHGALPHTQAESMEGLALWSDRPLCAQKMPHLQCILVRSHSPVTVRFRLDIHRDRRRVLCYTDVTGTSGTVLIPITQAGEAMQMCCYSVVTFQVLLQQQHTLLVSWFLNIPLHH